MHVPERWKVGKLSDLIKSLDAGVSVNSEDKTPNNEQYSVLKTSCVSTGVFNKDKRKVVLDHSEINRLKENVRGDSIIISRMNTPELVGANAYIEQKLENTFLPDRLWQVKAHKLVNMRWLGFWFGSQHTRYLLSHLATGTSGSMKNITKSDVLSLKIHIPPYQEQQKIAQILSTWDKAIEKLEALIAAKQKRKKALMQQLLTSKKRFAGFEDQKWKTILLSDFLIPTFREEKKPIENYLAIGVRSHCKGTFQKPDSEPDKIEMDKLYKVKKDDLIVNITFAWEGAIAIVKQEDEGGYVSHRFPTYTFNIEKAIPDFFRYIIQANRFRYMLDLISPGGAGRNRVLSKKEFLKIEWGMPCVLEQQKIASVLTATDKEIETYQKQLAALKQQKKGLMQQLLTGKRRVIIKMEN